ncbi:MAG: dTDP-4-dehydrorhamnose reductase [Candidatus Promineifilaceae bacterium]|nr:dTDP-4-dehydrorhamnose reductase [Candidatus Promineifilaceae bacterium]
MLRILITGAEGQLGQALQRVLQRDTVTGVDVQDGDITEPETMPALLARQPVDVVIHCAAYTDVDGCSRDPQRAYLINGIGTQNVALACRESGAAMVHVSTNEVFSGRHPEGYDEWSSLEPINAYGRSKAMAEVHAQDILERLYLVRTSWLFAPGGRNFIHAILRRARADGQVRVVADEVGSPTYVDDLAASISELIRTGQFGIYHLSNSGACSRWSFAQEVLRLAGLPHVKNKPILARQYRRSSTPPPFAHLNNNVGRSLGIALRPWQEALADYMVQHVNA